MRTVSVFGSTGSVGVNVLEVIRKFSAGQHRVLSLVANTNYRLLAEQALEFNVQLVVIREEAYYKPLKELLSSKNIKVVCGDDGILEACALRSDVVVGAIVGIAGLMPVYNAIVAGSDVLLANKESLVCAGKLIKDLVKRKGTRLVPVDSEHNAIAQVFDSDQRSSINKVILTASGGPFRGFPKERLKKVSIDDALKHPTWSMGKKITIDSATMFNKGLEIIEAHHLFDVKVEDIEVIVHPQSIIHSMVEYKDGSVLAQLSKTDMKVPILNALYYPKRYDNDATMECLDFKQIKKLTFEEVDEGVFPSLCYAKDALRKGDAAQVLFNAANEALVECFLSGVIGFYDIFDITGSLLSRSALWGRELQDINSIISFDKECKDWVSEYVARKNE